MKGTHTTQPRTPEAKTRRWRLKKAMRGESMPVRRRRGGRKEVRQRGLEEGGSVMLIRDCSIDDRREGVGVKRVIAVI